MTRSQLSLSIIAIAIAVNLYYQFPCVLHDYSNLQNLQSPPGQIFVSLRPYLKNVSWAGFYIDSRNVKAFDDVKGMFLYEQAQFCLSPTLLDYYDPLKYEFVIFIFKDRTAALRKISELHGHVVVITREGLILARRDK